MYPLPDPRAPAHPRHARTSRIRYRHKTSVLGENFWQKFCAVRMSYAWYYERISAVSAPPDLSGLERGGNAVATRIKVLRTPDPAF